MNFSNSVRQTLELQYEDEVRDLNITFDLIDRVRRIVAWEQLAVEMSKSNAAPNLTEMAKFVFLNLREAGFKPNIDKIYNEMMLSEEGKLGYMAVCSQLMLAYSPSGSSSKKKSVNPPTQLQPTGT